MGIGGNGIMCNGSTIGPNHARCMGKQTMTSAEVTRETNWAVEALVTVLKLVSDGDVQ